MAVFSVMHPYYVFITSFRVALCFVLLLDALGLNLKLLRRVSLMLPVIVIAGFKFDPAKLESVTEAIALCAPGSEMPPSEQLNLIAGVEIGQLSPGTAKAERDAAATRRAGRKAAVEARFLQHRDELEGQQRWKGPRKFQEWLTCEISYKEAWPLRQPSPNLK